MLKNYFKIAYRNLVRGKVHTIINIFGLTIGIASCVLIILYISHELSYDKFHEKSDRLYRLYIEGSFGDNEIKSAATAAPVKVALELEIAEVEHATRLLKVSSPIVTHGADSYVEEDFFYADENFFETFTLDFIEGNPTQALTRPNTMVITREMANKYFGNESPIGKSLLVNQTEMEITGVTEKVPSNSHIHFDFLGSMQTLQPDRWRSWISSNLYTYVVLHPGFTPDDISEKMHEMVVKYVGPEVEQVLGIDLEAFEEMGNSYGLFLEPVPDIHLRSTLEHQFGSQGNIANVYFFGTIAFFILLIACINFMNMATAKYSNRAKEVGVRKVVGSNRGQLVQQFLIESTIISLIAIILAMTVVELILPLFNQLSGKEMVLSYFANWKIIPGLLFFGIFVGILAGSYPAFFLSSFKPIKVLKGQATGGVSGSKFRGVLVVVQFAITIALFVGTFIVGNQLNYLKNKDLGFNQEEVLVLKRTRHLGESYNTFRDELLSNPNFINASYCNSLPGYDFGGTTVSIEGRPSEEMIQVGHVMIDENYFETLGINLSDGRSFSELYGTEDNRVIVNQRFIDVSLIDNPLEKRVMMPNMVNSKLDPNSIIGIIPNVHFESLHRDIRPMTFVKQNGAGSLLAIRVQTENIRGSIDFLERTWNHFVPNQPFVFSFLNSDLEQLYKDEERTSIIFSIFAALAILIACLGLFGMASFTAEKRTKEIGIRKVLGATEQSIFTLLSKQVLALVVFAAFLAWPIAWFAMNGWLENFAHRIKISPWVFLISTSLAFLIALITISYQALKAAMANPVDSLKYE